MKRWSLLMEIYLNEVEEIGMVVNLCWSMKT